MEIRRMENKSVVIILVLLLAGTALAPLGDQEIGGNLILTGTGKTLRVTDPNVPSGPTDTGTAGDMAWDSNYEYRCIATNTWRRSPLSTWAEVIEYLLLETGDFLLLENGDKLILE